MTKPVRIRLPSVLQSLLCLSLGLASLALWAGSRDEDKVFADRFELDTDASVMLSPGVLSSVDDKIMLGAHPQALEASQALLVRRLDPPDELLTRDRRLPLRPIGDMLELVATDLEKDTDLLLGRGRAAFILAIPVPDDVDTDRLVPMMKGWGAFAMQHEMDPSEFPDIWMPINGVYDPDQRLYLVDLPTIGNQTFPTQLVLVEHPWMKTESIQPILEWLEKEYLPMAAEARPDQRLPTWKTGPNWEPARSAAEPFDVRCELLQGDPSACLIDANIFDLFSAMGPHLAAGKSEFENQMVGSPTPRLKTNDQDQYIYYLSDQTSRSTCSKYRGYYNGVTKNAWTCVEVLALDQDDGTGGLATTRHELFHTIQFDYGSVFRRWVTEGTASLVQHPVLSIHRAERPVDVALQSTGNSYAYQAEHFWFDLLLRSELANVRGVSRILREGLTTSAAKSFIENRTPFETLGEAHWHWAANALFVGDIELPVWDASPANYRYTHRCEPNPGSLLNGIQQLTLSATSQTEIEVKLPPLSATLVELVLPPQENHHLYEISYERTSLLSSGPMIRVFTEQSEPFEGACNDTTGSLIRAYQLPGAQDPDIDEGTAAILASALSPPAQTDPRRAWVLISNPGEIRSSTFVLRASSAQTEPSSYLGFPPVEEWQPVARDVEIEMGGETTVDAFVLDNDDAGYAGGTLTIIDPPGVWRTTPAGNRYRSAVNWSGDTMLLEFEIANSQFDGVDSVPYTIRNEHGYTDSATLTVTRSVIPIANDFTVKVGLGSETIIDPRDAVFNPAGGDIWLQGFETLDPFRGGMTMTSQMQTARRLIYTAGGLSPDVALYGYVDRATYEISNRVGLVDTGTVTIEVNRPNFELAVDTSPVFPPEITPCRIHFGSSLGPDLFARVGLQEDRVLGSSVRIAGKDLAVGSLSGSFGQTVLKDINDQGLAVGWSSDEKGAVRPVLWDSLRGTLSDIGSNQAGTQGRLFGMTDSGFLAGQQVDELGSRVLLVRGQQQWLLDQGELIGGSLALGTAAKGDQVFGVYGLPNEQEPRNLNSAFLQPPGGGSPACNPGFAPGDGLFGGGAAAFFYDIISAEFPQRGNLYLLPSLGGDLTIPRAANANGVVVGTSAVSELPDRSSGYEELLRAFVWSAKDGMVELPTLGGGYTEALAISDTGLVAGTGTDAEGRQAGFVWEQGLMLDLNELLPKDSAWRIVSANEIRRDGSILAWAQNLGDKQARLVPVIFRPPAD